MNKLTALSIPVSSRGEGMVSAGPDYVQSSAVWADIMNAKGLEYDRVQDKLDDLELQLSPYTATWGLVFWELSVGLAQRPTESFDLRRPQVLTRLRNSANFSLEMIRAIIDNYGEPATVTVYPENNVVSIVFHQGIPTHIYAIQQDIENIIHAHLGPDHEYEYRACDTFLRLGSRSTVGAFVTIKPYTEADYRTAIVMQPVARAAFVANITVKSQGV